MIEPDGGASGDVVGWMGFVETAGVLCREEAGLWSW